jgi:hypothetical protein
MNMNEIMAQGDILFERVDDTKPSGEKIKPEKDGAVVVAEGELTGHRHTIYDKVAMFKDEALARDIPDGLYLGHIRVQDDVAYIKHQEHAPIGLTRGTWRARRQRELEPSDVRIIPD